ncbi:MAG: peptidase and in, kexin, sedolisin [Acidobacteria bacterium]|nr:peptidase and in, kexin, sedolisin [Acidobacteriota bacterium]
MRTAVRNKSRILLLTLALSLFLFATGGSAKLTPGPQIDASKKSDAAPEPVPVIEEAAELQRVLSSAETATVIMELEGEPVVVHQKNLFADEEQKFDLNSPQAAAYESQLAAQQENFKDLARKLSPNLRVIAELRTLLNAISIEAPGTDLAAIATLPGVKQVHLRKQYHVELNTSVPLINAPAAWAKVGGSGSAGQGIRIAILDTGIDKSNPLFADAGFTAPAGFPRGNLSFTNNKIIVAKAYLQGTGATPLDQNGHGTNVAGIAAGDFNTSSPLAPLSGVAPHAFLGNYRVLDSSGTGFDDLIANALQDALADGFDVANLSLGGPATTSLGLLDQAVENAVSAGMTVVIAAGNTGDSGPGTIESPGVAPSAITVGASSNAHVVGPGANITVSGLSTIGGTVGQGGAASSNLSSTLGPAVYVDADPAGRGCAGLPAGSLTGKIALLERGNCSFATKVSAASSAGAGAAIIYNKSISEGSDGGDTIIIMDVSGPPAATIPSLFVSRTNGLALVNWLGSHAGAQATLTPVALIDLSNPADVLSSFSSRGPSSLRALKPDLVAPGEQIYSGAITASNPDGVSDPSGFAAVSGTSQATPHVAGAAALLKQLHPTWTPLQIKSALISSANNAVFTDSTKTVNAGVLDDGGGRADLSLASSVKATFAPASLSYGYVSVGAQPVQIGKDLQITNQSGGPNTYAISFQNLNPGTGISLSASASPVSPAAGQSTTVTITVNASGGAAAGDRTGYVVITDQNSQVLRVPYWVRFQPAPSVQFNSAVFSISEGPPAAGATARTASIVVTRSGDSTTTVSVDFATSDGTGPTPASQRTDYTTASGTITFAPGQTTRSFSVPIIDDGYVEQTETVNLSLSNAVGADLGSPNQAVLSIDDDEEEPSSTNPLDDPTWFVRQHYFDFLSRTPDSGGFAFWIGKITTPPCGDPACLLQRRISVSNSFFFELEFQQTGAYVFRLYRAAYGNNQPFPNTRPDPNFPNEEKKLPSYQVFSRDRAKVIGGSNLAQKQLDLASLFVSRAEFLTKYPASLNTADLFVNAVLAQIQTDLGVNLGAQRAGLITLYNSGGRAAVMYRLADDNAQTNPINNRALIDEEYNRAFVATQYFGYLRRNPDIAGILFWLNQVNSAPLRDLAKQNAMVCSFITSGEYQFRFAGVAPHSNAECPQ